MTVVRVDGGLLEGELVASDVGGRYLSFKGIPYAAPPLGELRFKEPQPAAPWEGSRSANRFGPACHQFDMFTMSVREGQEDCLYLNVYSPDVKPETRLPVMVWIHGGAFMSGSGDDDLYGPEFLVRRGVVLVTFNYRLDIVGFLSLETEDVPGNAGMKDQVAALRWVNQNIDNFGGDPSNITIFGESAGAASVAFHLVSPMSKGLFKRAIVQSGSTECWWSQSFRPRERARLLARQMGLDSDDDKELYEFFKSQPIQNLILKSSALTYNEQHREGINLYFSVVDEKKFAGGERFFYGEIKDCVHANVEIVAGYTKDEGLLVMGMNYDLERTLQQVNFVTEYWVPKGLSAKCPMAEQLEVAKLMYKYYFNNKLVSKENLEPLVRYLSMDMFIYGTMRWVRKVAAAGRNKVYLYRFSCTTERNVMSRVFAVWPEAVAAVAREVADGAGGGCACHADDLAHLFPVRQLRPPAGPAGAGQRAVDVLTKLWTDFAKCGNPTPDAGLGATWSPYTSEGQEYLEIGRELRAGRAPDRAELRLWDEALRPCDHYWL